MEKIPKKIGINTADVWMNKKIDPTKEKGLGLEISAEEDTLMGRLGKRMAARDFIDNLDLGTKPVKEVSDNTIEAPKGIGQHFHIKDKKAVNFSDPIPEKMVLEGNTMGQQARKADKVVGEDFNIVGKRFSDDN